MKNFSKNIFWAIITFLIVTFLFSLAYQEKKAAIVLSLDQLTTKINSNEISKITVSANNLDIELANGEKAIAKKEFESGLSETLRNFNVDANALKKVNIEVKEESGWKYWASILIPSLLPLLIIGWFFWMMFRQAGRGMSQAMTFGKANIKLFTQFKDRVTFNDVAGLKEAKQELMEVVDFLKNPKKYLDIGAKIPRGVLLYGAPGTGKCIVGESLIPTNKGLIEIQDIPKYFWVEPKTNEIKGAELPTINMENVAFEKRSASHWYDLGEQNTIKITLNQGTTLEGTPEHPIMCLSQNGRLVWKSLSELREGDITAIHFNTQSFGTLKEIDIEQSYLMGLLTGDGNLSHSNRIGFTTTDKELVNTFTSYINKRYPDIPIKIASDGITYLTNSWKIKKDFYRAGMSYLLSYDKIIPPSIMMASKEVVTAFLQGLFDADGYFERYNAGFATVSKKLSDQVMALLLNFGVIPKRRIKSGSNEKHSREVYEITISGTSLPVFAQKIGFRLERKQKAIENYLATHLTGNTNVDIFPYLDDLVNECWQALQIKQKSSELLSCIIDKVRQRKRISRRSLRILVSAYEKSGLYSKAGEYLKSLLLAQLFFSPVAKIESGRARVFDFTVSQIHSFISNGIISHNTLLARAVAGEANVPFFHISGSEFVEMFVGVGASRVRDLFDTAKKAGRAIIFIDEIDAVGRERGAGLGGGHDEREQTLNQILVEMDGFEKNDKRIVVAATNRPDVLDTALLRPGRFDRRVILDLPDINDREEILKIHAKGKIQASDIDIRKIAERTPGFSGADLANLLNEAALLAARKNQKEIKQLDIFESIEKVLLGPERRSRVFSKKEKDITAYHEAGHALVAASLKNADPVHKVSIVARGRAGGYTLKLPIEETYLRTKSQFMTDLAMMLGGYIAEKSVFGDVSTGASSDLQSASSLTRKLITKYGMSEKLGPITFGKTDEMIFLGREIATEKNYSEDVAKQIDEEVKNFIKKAYDAAEKIIASRKKVLDAIAKTLIEKETIEREEFDNLIKSFKLKLVEIK